MKPFLDQELVTSSKNFHASSRDIVPGAPPLLSTSRTADKPKRLVIPQLDTMRFFAFLSVFFFHTLPLGDVERHSGLIKFLALSWMVVRSTGANGVGLFFVLSAYLITEILRRERNFTGSIDLRLFYTRRALRIWPLYFLAVGLGLLWQYADAAFRLSGRDLLTFVFFVKNWDIMLHGWNWNPVYILWTVSAEEQFYLIWPLAQKLLNGRWMLYLCIAAVFLIPALSFLPHTILANASIASLYFDFIFFPIGGILALVLNGRHETRSTSYCLVMAAAGLSLWLAGGLLNFPEVIANQSLSLWLIGNIIIATGTVLIFLAFLGSPKRWSIKPLVYLGRISYGLYVYHIMAYDAVRMLVEHFGLPGITYPGRHSSMDLLFGLSIQLPLALAITIAVSALSYQYFERPFLKLKQRFAIVPSGAS